MGSAFQQRSSFGTKREGSGGNRNKCRNGRNRYDRFGRGLGCREATGKPDKEKETSHDTGKQHEGGVGGSEELQWGAFGFRSSKSGEQLLHHSRDDPPGQRAIQASFYMVQSNKSISVVLRRM